MQERLNKAMKERSLQLLLQKQNIAEEYKTLERALHGLQRQIETSPKSELIANTPGLIRMIRQLQKKPHVTFTKPVSADFPSEVIPSYDSGIFQINDYNACRANADEHVVYSNPIHVNGLSWRLKVYPNGTGAAKGAFLSVFLEMWKGLKEPTIYEYRVEMVIQRVPILSNTYKVNHKNPHNTVVREFSSLFEVGECWGYNRFYRIDLLTKEGFLSSDTGALLFRFYVRPPNYFERAREQKRYLQQIELERDRLQLHVNALKKKLAEVTDGKITDVDIDTKRNIIYFINIDHSSRRYVAYNTCGIKTANF